MTIFVGIELGGYSWRIAYAIESLGSPSSSPPPTFTTNLACEGINLNLFVHLVGLDPADPSLKQYTNSTENLTSFRATAPILYGHPAEMGLKLYLNSSSKPCFVSGSYLLALVFRHVFHKTSAGAPDAAIQAAISIPHWFDQSRKEAIARAALMAGFKPVGLFSSALATVSCYKSTFPLSHFSSLGPNSGSQERVLFIDVGHTTTTATIAVHTPRKISIQSIEFNTNLGGRDVDLALARHFGMQVIDSKMEPTRIRQASFFLVHESNKAKEKLSHGQDADIDVYIPTIGVNLRTRLSSDIIVQVSIPVLKKVFDLVQNTLIEAELEFRDIDIVILLGFTTLMFKSAIMIKLPEAIYRDLDISSIAEYALEVSKTIPTDVPSEAWVGKGPVGESLTWNAFALGNNNKDTSPLLQPPYVNRSKNSAEMASASGENYLAPGTSDTSFRLHPDNATILNSVSQKGPDRSLSDLQDDILRLSAAVDEVGERDPTQPDRCNNLCAAYLEKYELTGDIFALNHATLWAAKALGDVDFTTKAKHTHLSNLASCLNRQYKHSGDLDLLDKSILYQSYVVDTLSDDDPNSSGYLINYGAFLQNRGNHLGQISDLEIGAKHIQRAIGILLEHPEKLDADRLNAALNNLGNILRNLYQWTGQLDQLHKMIHCHEMALTFTKVSGPARAANLNSCGAALMLHHKHLGAGEDLDKAIQYFTEALQCIPLGHPSKSIYLGNYADALNALYSSSPKLETIARAIEMAKQSLSLDTVGRSQKAIYLNKIGSLLSSKFKATGSIEDLNEALQNHETAVELTEDHQFMQRFYFSHNLGLTLHIRSEELDLPGDLDRAINVYQEALTLIDGGSGSDRAKTVYQLASAYYSHFLRHRKEETRIKSMDLCKDVLNSLAPLTLRFQAAKLWTGATAWSRNGDSALEATTAMVGLLSQLAWPGLSLESQINVLKQARQAACDAAAIALHYKDKARALEWLEQGRTVAWNQILQMRSPLVDLKDHDTKLADEIIRLSQALERGQERPEDSNTLNIKVDKFPGFSRNVVALERDNLLKQARAIPGFEGLMTSKEYADFAVASYDGPIIVINVSRYACDAIILTAGCLPFHLPLPDFSLADAETLRNLLVQALKDASRLQRGTGDEVERAEERYGKPRRVRTDPEVVDATFRHILKELYVKVVQPIMNYLGVSLELPKDMPHVWWCPTGPLTSLPLHAAGIYAADGDQDTARVTVLDYLVSSYIPNLSALHNIMYKPRNGKEFKMLSVIQPNTPGKIPLPATLKELQTIREHMKDFTDRIQLLEGEDATTESVMEGMKECSWVHLACHGEQNMEVPTESGLHLHNGTLSLRDVIRNPLHNADFAFLSACQTASGDISHQDEAIHLAAGMLLAGYNSVIASMWSIGDSDAAMVVDDVYAYLFEGGEMQPDSRKAARALHRAVCNLKTKHSGLHGGSGFAEWIPFIHVGM